MCGDCERLQLDCVYLPPQKRRSRRTRIADAEVELDKDAISQSGYGQQDVHLSQSNVATQLNDNDALVPSHSAATSDDLFQAMDTAAEASGINTTALYEPEPSSASNNAPGFMLDSSVGAGSVLDAFGKGVGSNTDWQAGILNDYLALPDPTFPFTSMAFIGSLDMPSSHAGMTGCAELEAAASDGLEAAGAGNGNEQQDAHSQISTTPDGRYSFTVSPPLLSPSQEESLLAYFERQIRPPASLVGVDPVGWTKIWRCAVKMARARHEPVLHAVFALSTLLTASTASIRLGVNRNDHVLFASRLQEAACAAMQVGISHPDWEKKNSQALLVSIFLLAWFEVGSWISFLLSKLILVPRPPTTRVAK